MATRADSPGCAPTFQVGEDAANLWLLLGGPSAAGLCHKISARAAGIGRYAARYSLPLRSWRRAATAATESRNA